MAHLHLNELSLICDMWLNKITYLLTYLSISFVRDRARFLAGTLCVICISTHIHVTSLFSRHQTNRQHGRLLLTDYREDLARYMHIRV